MNNLEKENLPEFKDRFGNCYDCVINSIYINKYSLHINIEVDDCDSADRNKRRLLSLYVEKLIEYKFVRPNNIDIYVLYNGLNIYFKNSLVFLDLQSVSIEASLAEIQESYVYCVGEFVKWEINVI